jgi:hypothetical protein
VELQSDVEGVKLSRVATELTKGRRSPDRNAVLVGFSSPNEDQLFLNGSTLLFKYTVCEGDATSDLE